MQYSICIKYSLYFGKLYTDTETVDLNKGDTLFIDSMEKFCWEGDLLIYTACTPAYYPEQHKEIK